MKHLYSRKSWLPTLTIGYLLCIAIAAFSEDSEQNKREKSKILSTKIILSNKDNGLDQIGLLIATPAQQQKINLFDNEKAFWKLQGLPPAIDAYVTKNNKFLGTKDNDIAAANNRIQNLANQIINILKIVYNSVINVEKPTQHDITNATAVIKKLATISAELDKESQSSTPLQKIKNSTSPLTLEYKKDLAEILLACAYNLSELAEKAQKDFPKKLEPIINKKS